MRVCGVGRGVALREDGFEAFRILFLWDCGLFPTLFQITNTLTLNPSPLGKGEGLLLAGPLLPVPSHLIPPKGNKRSAIGRRRVRDEGVWGWLGGCIGAALL